MRRRYPVDRLPPLTENKNHQQSCNRSSTGDREVVREHEIDDDRLKVPLPVEVGYVVCGFLLSHGLERLVTSWESEKVAPENRRTIAVWAIVAALVGWFILRRIHSSYVQKKKKTRSSQNIYFTRHL